MNKTLMGCIDSLVIWYLKRYNRALFQTGMYGRKLVINFHEQSTVDLEEFTYDVYLREETK